MATKETIGDDLKKYVQQNINDLAENHIDCWKDRYFRKSKKDIRNDLQGHDSCLEIENAEEHLDRKLNYREKEYLVNNFNREVVKIIY